MQWNTLSSLFILHARIPDRSNQMLTPKIRPQIHNLPHPQRDQHAHSPKGEPLDSFVRTLVRVSELLLSGSQVFHLVHDFIHGVLDPSEFGLDRLQFFGGLDGGPHLERRRRQM